MAYREYIRPYQYEQELRLFAVIRNSDSTMLVGTGFADNAVAYLESDRTLKKLDQVSVNHANYDVLTVQRFEASYPFTLYVVNPDEEDGQASNAIEYTATAQVPVIDVIVDGKSVVKDQIAAIDLSGKLDVLMRPNKIYGTDADGKETQFDRSQIEGVQNVYVNGIKQEVDQGNAYLKDIASESKTVQKTTNKNVIYGTDNSGNQTLIDVSRLATSADVNTFRSTLDSLQNNKQDKDTSAQDGSIAVMKDSQSIGSSTKLADLLKTISDNYDAFVEFKTEVNSKLDSKFDEVVKSSATDWKATSGLQKILNHPVSSSNITISELDESSENMLRNVTDAVIVGLSPRSAGTGSASIGKYNSTTSYAFAAGYNANASNESVAAGHSASASSNSIAIGKNASAFSNSSVSIGPDSSTSAQNAVAIGNGAVGDIDDAVSVGATSKEHRIVHVKDPVDDQDAATKKYVDSQAAILKAMVQSIVDKIYGGGTIDASTGNITWPNDAKVPVAKLNIYSNNSSGDAIDNAIRSRAADTNGDIKVA